MEQRLEGVKRMPYEQALRASTTHRHDYLNRYVTDLETVLDFDAIRSVGVRIGVDPLGGAGVHYWPAIAERYRLALTIVSDVVDPTFRFMTLDWDGRIRMDPSSPYAMQRLVALKDRFDVAFACDTDHDRHGIVRAARAAATQSLSRAVPLTISSGIARIGARTSASARPVVSSAMIDRVTARAGPTASRSSGRLQVVRRRARDGSLGFCGEESAGASFLRRDGTRGPRTRTASSRRCWRRR